MVGVVVWSGGGFFYACTLMLAIALVQAAVSKAVRPVETASGFAALGVPGAPVVARVVPVVEIGVAVALIAVPRIGGVAALVMLTAFTFFLARAVRAGVRAGCNCFGQTTGQPVSGVDLVRNALLAGLAAAALYTDHPVALPLFSVLAALAVVTAYATLLRWLRA